MSGLPVSVGAGRVNALFPSRKSHRSPAGSIRLQGNPLYLCAVGQSPIPLSFEHA
jgi:hypothetical protein